MKKVFIGGSITCRTLPQEAITALDKIMELGLHVLIGDAPGVDATIQAYLQEKKYEKVTIYHMVRKLRICRNYDWARKPIANIPGARTQWTAKDMVMRNDCDYGFFVWDGKSKGTLENMESLKVAKKGYRVFKI